MTRQQLISAIRSMGSYLSVGLDPDPEKLPRHLRDQYGVRGIADAIFEFNRQIIDATKEHCVAYKINTAFYEALGVKGWEVMERTVDYIPATHFKIADAKRGDIGNTSSRYARAFFEALAFDAVTVAPYMGWDSVRPFLEYKDRWTIVLGLTSNPGAEDFELRRIEAGEGMEMSGKVFASAVTMWSREEYLYERVRRIISIWSRGLGRRGEVSRKSRGGR
jgi:orotidine-5'-phosphate decarboxylase